MKMTNFESVKENATFVYGNMMMVKQLGAATPADTPRFPVDYNAIDTRTGDVWEMDDTDLVYVIPETKTDEKENTDG